MSVLYDFLLLILFNSVRKQPLTALLRMRRDKAREKLRQVDLKRSAEARDAKPKFVSKKAKAWSESKIKKQNKKLKREQRRKRKEKMVACFG